MNDIKAQRSIAGNNMNDFPGHIVETIDLLTII